MSKYVPGRDPNMLGCNIHPGITPGGFNHTFLSGSTRATRSKVRTPTLKIRQAADAALLKHEFFAEPKQFSPPPGPEAE